MRNIKTILTAALFVSSVAFAASTNTSVTTTATKPAVALGALSAVDGNDSVVSSLSFGTGALVKDAETDASSLLKFKLAGYDNAVSGQSFTLAFGMPSVAGYTFKYKINGGGSTAVAPLSGSLAAGSSSSAVYVGSGAATSSNGGATSVLFTVTADGSASDNLTGSVTVTITAN